MALESRKTRLYGFPTLQQVRGRAIPAVLMAVFLEAVTLSAAAQLPSVLKSQTKPADQEIQAEDPLGRSTPRGTINGFIRATHHDDLVAASSYMQLTDKQKPNASVLAQDLKDLMDRYFTEPLSQISDSPTGALDDGLPLDREHVGPLKMKDKAVNIIMVRVNDPVSGEIWLISSDTLEQVPALHGVMEEAWLDRVMPEALSEHTLFDISAAQWLLWSVSLGLPSLLLLLFFRFIALLFRKVVTSPLQRARFEVWTSRLRWPTITVLTLIIHGACVFLASSSVNFRIRYSHFVSIFLVLALAWLLGRIMHLLFEHARFLARARGQSGSESLILLGRRVFNAVLAIVAIFTILTIAGVDTKTALAGVGIGGVAVAFGAQKSVENLLGGVFLLTDKALAIGDTCSISNRVGTVEDITLRSVRLRTTEQTLLSIPAGVLSQANIENFASRQKILVRTTLQLNYKTTAGQLKSVLNGIQYRLTENSRVERETAYVRLTDFGPQAIELELFAYILTTNGPEFLALREALLLEIAEVVESAGSSFAGPTQFVYLEHAPTEAVDGNRGVSKDREPANAVEQDSDSRESVRQPQPVVERIA
jgi:MscS family membrane protein